MRDPTLAAAPQRSRVRALVLVVLALAVRGVSAQTVPGGAPQRDASGDPIRGLALMSAFRDSLPRHSGNRLRCVSCHLDNGTRATAMPWSGTATRYPRYRARPGTEESLARRVNECIARSLAGRMLHEDSREMRDMLAYIETLRDKPRPQSVDSVLIAGVASRGRRGYAATCTRCHGVAGEGTATAPAVWGSASYSIGAGLARQFSLATFLRHNMPFDHAISLSDQQAADIAAYVLTRPRQDHPGKERDWPKGDAPPDVAYATTSARAAGAPLPKTRPLLRRRVSPDSLSPPH
jgi:thiosulfate dehydrogenase